MLISYAADFLLAVVFLYSGADKLLHWRDGVAEVGALGLPFPVLFAAATIFVQLLGGFAVATGVMAGVGAMLLALFTAMATLLGHQFWLRHGREAKQELTAALEHLAIIGGLLLVVAQHGVPG